MTPEECKKEYRKVKVKLMQMPHSTFICNVLFSMQTVWTDKLPTAGVDGTTVYINPEFFKELTFNQRLGLFLHEAWHVALMHMVRRGNRDPQTYNRAGDYVINLMIDDAGIELPEGGLLDSKYRGMTTEQVYDKLIQDDPKGSAGSMGGDVLEDATGSSDDDGDGEGGGKPRTPEQQRDLERRIEDIVVKASVAAAQANEKVWGNGSPEADRLIDELVNPVLPWQTILQNFMSAFNKTDYSSRKFNRKYLPDMYLPTLYSEAVPDIYIYIDASGSVSDEDFTKFLSEANSIKEMLKPEKMVIQSFDTALRDRFEFAPEDSLDTAKMRGYGGTAINPVIGNIIEETPEITIVFTDGYFSNDARFPEAAQSTNLFWLIYDNANWQTEHGEVIHFNLDT